MKNDPFKEYLKQSDPDKRYKSFAWCTAIGLQSVDGLNTSPYLSRIIHDKVVKVVKNRTVTTFNPNIVFHLLSE